MSREQLEAARERSRSWYQQRYARGQCHTIGCRNPLVKINPQTGRTFWCCLPCRRIATAKYKAARRVAEALAAVKSHELGQSGPRPARRSGTQGSPLSLGERQRSPG